MPRSNLLLAWLTASLLAAPAVAQAPPPYRDPRTPVAERVHDLLGRMTAPEKFWQLFMIPGDRDSAAFDYSRGSFGLQVSAPDTGRGAARAHAGRINAIQDYFVDSTRLGIPLIPFEEALHGLARPGATVFPQAIGLAATWDTSLMRRVAGAIAAETRSRGIRQVLSPVVNLATDVRWGRTEETYGEDPLLASRMAAAYVGAMERAGVIATPKHFVANVGEGGRDSYPIEVSGRQLEELYFPPFRAALAAGARSIMTAYNSVDGLPATQNRRLLTDRLRRDWGFSGFVISDAAATGGATVLHHTEASTATATVDALNAGLDVIFQSSYPQHRPYLDAFRRGLIAQTVIDSAVSRVLRAKFELGLFDHPFVDADSAALVNRSPEHRALALEAARASIVLLRNERGALPLRPGLRSVAVIGTDAVESRLGGYSAPSPSRTTILDGLHSALGPGVVRYTPGPGRLDTSAVVVPASALALSGAYFTNNRLEGTPVLVRRDPAIDFRWTLNSPAAGISYDWYSARWTGTLTAPAGGVAQIGIEGNDGYRLWLDDRLLIDDWRKVSYGTRLVPVRLAPGSKHAIRLEYYESTGNARLRLLWDAGVTRDAAARIDSAVALARRSEVAIVVAGIEEGEFRDRARLGLPGRQEELIQRVAATGTPTVVVLVGGSAITMPWLDRVSAVVDVWYPGEAGGTAVTDVLTGRYDPAGRLPITFPIAEGQLPLRYNHKPTGRGDDYVDLTGQPLFPFGYGLSYTTFEYSALAIAPGGVSAPAGTIAALRFNVTNTGPREGSEVVQLYLHQELASVAQPVMRLAGFERVHLGPGESRAVSFAVTRGMLEILDRDLHRVLEPGDYRVMIGSSSKDIRLRDILHVNAP
jgi:beta-glucosidase